MTNPRSKNITKRKRLNTRLVQTPTASSIASEPPASGEPTTSNEPSTSREPPAASNEIPPIRFDEDPAFQVYLKEILLKCIDISLKNKTFYLFNSYSRVCILIILTECTQKSHSWILARVQFRRSSPSNPIS